jgi:hypothetical protein
MNLKNLKTRIGFTGLALFFIVHAVSGSEQWIPFGPGLVKPDSKSVLDLRHLNEAYAGENGWIRTDGHRFIHETTGEPVRFWGVNIAPRDDFSMADWQYLARLLAAYGVNQLRIHGSLMHGAPYTRVNQSPELDRLALSSDKVDAVMKAVAAMKAEGIYTHLSIYFPLWFRPPADSTEFPGYTGSQRAFAAIYFNENLEKRYDSWWRVLLLEENPYTGVALKEDPAVMSLELVNEDSLFFPTFDYSRIPAAQMAIVENRFADWLLEKHETYETIPWLKTYPHDRDKPKENRIGIASLQVMPERRSARDGDTLAFLFEMQRDWYESKVKDLRALGFKGLITASNWHTADDAIYDGLERASYMAGDFIDHHKAYFHGISTGEDRSWSIREGQTYFDRSQLTFEPRDPRKADQSVGITFLKPTWNNRPTMVSETAWNRPNRYRTEGAPLYAVYGALHDIDAIDHFTFDSNGRRWAVQPRYAMQPWTIQTPAMMGQFPAAALIYRKGLVAEAGDAAVIELNLEEQLAFKGLPYAQQDGIDALREEDHQTDQASTVSRDDLQLRGLLGKIRINISGEDKPSQFPDPGPRLDPTARQAVSLTDELTFDWGRGLLRIDAPMAQGFVLSRPQEDCLKTTSLELQTDLDIFSLLLVSLDGQPVSTSRRMLLQVMTEERSHNFTTRPAPGGHPEEKLIEDTGVDPWEIRPIQGKISFTDSAVKVTPLDQSGYPGDSLAQTVHQLDLLPDVVYYLIER